ncbi:PREDICTED: uncharacterized protein LOC104718251 [Camelina sativa]|uniref:Uncharacterized protein LOC104718251 n=1 Tax=Camelina sativa TaxID=90675 RepID=A0ABM0U103_CAMSA|nr:PREDICTED: uncharacterized protein LOC104718251 [Camelina sativa]
MPLPWKKSKSSRISRFVTDLQQSPKHGGSLVVETGFPTSLIDLFVKNRDRLKKQSSKRVNNNNNKTPAPTRRRVSSPPHPHPLPPSLSLQRRMSLPLKLDPALVTEDPPLVVSKIEDESFVPENRRDGGGNGCTRGGGCCVLMVVVFKVFMVAVLALSTTKLAVGITLSASALLFLELAVARVFTLLNICPDAQVRIDSLIEKLIGKRHKEKIEEEEEVTTSTHDRRSKVSFEIVEEPREEEIRVVVPQSDSNSSMLEKTKPVAEEEVEEKKEVQTIRDVVFKNEKSKSAKLKSKIVKKIVPKKLRSYKKKKKMKMKEKEEAAEGEGEVEVEIEEEGSMTEVSSLYSDERLESESSERDDVSSNPPLLEEEEGEEIGSKGGDLTKVIGLIVIVLVGLLIGKVFAIGLTLSSCLILRVFCCKSRTSL